ncbi:hypothetical protein VKT23_016993 [Stygiomarasmius scandens]|uniref:Uncharacterized protein n=1 Tax=Marasmiellus scandens TaxID=2682957 RepID=A0ABR1IXV1_9AGAR
MHWLVSRQEAPRETEAHPFVVFDVLHALALLLLLVTYIAALISRSIVRMKTWFCLILSCIVYCISFLALVGHQGGPQPPLALCVFQSGLIYAAPPTVAAAGFSFVTELYMRLSSSLTIVEVSHRKITMLMFFAPVVHLIILWEAILYGVSNLHLVERIPSGMYCHVNSITPPAITGITVGVLMVAMLSLEVYIGHYLWRRRSGFACLRASGSDSVFTYKLLIRVATFTFGGLMAVAVTIFINFEPATATSDVALNLLAILPLLVALLFGFQTGYLKVYIFWKKKPLPTLEGPPNLPDPKVPIQPESIELEVV